MKIGLIAAFFVMTLFFLGWLGCALRHAIEGKRGWFWAAMVNAAFAMISAGLFLQSFSS